MVRGRRDEDPEDEDEDHGPSAYDRTEDYDDAEGEDGGYGPGKGYSREVEEEYKPRASGWVGKVLWVLGVLALIAVLMELLG